LLVRIVDTRFRDTEAVKSLRITLGYH